MKQVFLPNVFKPAVFKPAAFRGSTGGPPPAVPTSRTRRIVLRQPIPKLVLRGDQ